MVCWKMYNFLGHPVFTTRELLAHKSTEKNLSFQRRLYLINLDKPEAVALALY